MSVERLTTKRTWEEAQNELSNEMGYSHIWTRLNQIENILGDDYDLDHLRELVEADRNGRCVVLPFKPHKTMWSCSKSNPKPAKAYYATEMGILADMKAGCVFGETPEATDAALAKEARP